ncbi:MAG TPA: OstA-like protein [Bacteroidales bacterium]|jgi:lipopolysaccharide export system protein LptA|nr:OstA-like protein [Bacteroidales bacterium]HQH25294.1 OstA-like protein [Bacteroidales bacterium]HQJ82484.1 OstA-like protein [Bacteroidales bacterium]
MAKVNLFQKIRKLIPAGQVVYAVLIFIVTIAAALQPQEISGNKPGKRKIILRHADEDIILKDRETGKDWHRLLGSVSLEHNQISMFCDSAHFYPDKNQVKAYGSIHIEQGDTLDIYGNYLFYDGITEIAVLTGNAELVDKETHLYTNSITYDVKSEIAQYRDSGRIINGDNTLTSKIGRYYTATRIFNFKNDVKITNPDYIMTADTMDYNTETKTAFFTGPSEMKGDSIYIYCERGWYDTGNKISRIWKNALLDNRKQIIRGDSLYYEENNGYGLAFGNASITDTSHQVSVAGDYAWYYREPERFMITDSAVFIQISDKDSLYLHGDTIRSVTLTDSLGISFRLMSAYYGCRIFSRDMQAKCDSLSYSFRDSVIRFYNEPVLWAEENQMTSDSMALFTKNRKADRMELFSSAFVASQVDTMRYNQIRGRSLTGYFRDNELYKIEINGNGESLYYLGEGDEIMAVNKATSSEIEIYIDNGKISVITENQSPEGVIDPPSEAPQGNPHLEGFRWYDHLRPKKILDIFKH